MPKGILFHPPRLGISVAASAKCFFYEPGSTTKRNTYSDVDLTSANANPVVANSAGLFGSIYLDPSLGYKVVLSPSTDSDPPASPILTQDNAYLPAMFFVDQMACNGRLTLESGVAVSTTDQSAKTTLYWTPYGGNRVAIYNATKAAWEMFTFTERSITLVGLTASTPYDVFVYDSSGTPTLELTAWTNSTTRATALTTQDGVYVKSGATTRRYLGTIYINSTGGQSDDTYAKRYVWNYYNRGPRPMRVRDTTDSWNYTTAVFRQANGSTANQLDFVVGVDEDGVEANVIAFASNTGAVTVIVGIGLDSTTGPATGCLNGNMSIAAGLYATGVSSIRTFSGIGRHTLTWLEYSVAAGTTTWYGDNAGSLQQSGISGCLRG